MGACSGLDRGIFPSRWEAWLPACSPPLNPAPRAPQEPWAASDSLPFCAHSASSITRILLAGCPTCGEPACRDRCPLPRPRSLRASRLPHTGRAPVWRDRLLSTFPTSTLPLASSCDGTKCSPCLFSSHLTFHLQLGLGPSLVLGTLCPLAILTHLLNFLLSLATHSLSSLWTSDSPLAVNVSLGGDWGRASFLLTWILPRHTVGHQPVSWVTDGRRPPPQAKVLGD